MKQNPSASNRTTILVVAGLMGLGVIALIALVVLALRPEGVTVPAPTPTVAPALFIPPAPDCGTPTLSIGANTFQIQTIQLAPDGSVAVPADVNNMAYWVDGTDLESLFFLSPTPENLALVAALVGGEQATTTWSNCNSLTYTLSAPQAGTFGPVYLPDQTTTSIKIFVQPDPAGNGFVIGGAVTGEQIVSVDTPASNSTELQAEISLLEIIPAPDGTSLQLKVSVFNYGGTPFTLSAGDVALTAADGAPLPLILSDPELPREISPGDTLGVSLNFPRPASTTATLKIFTVEYEIEGY